MTTRRENLRRFVAYLPYGLLVVLTLAVTGADTIWRHLETRPPHWDMGFHLVNSLTYLSLFKAHSLRFITQYTYYPPFRYWASVPFYLILGRSMTVAVFSNVVFIAILIGSVYLLGQELWDKRVGLLASLFVVTTPMLVSQFKEYQLDAPLTAMVALSLYLLIKTRNFEDKTFSVLFGLAFGFGLLTKWTLPFILLLPLVYAVGGSIRQFTRTKDNGILRNLVLVGLISFAIAGPWYQSNLPMIRHDLSINSTAAGIGEGDPVVDSLASNTWYLMNLLNNQLYLFPLILFVIGLGLMVRRQNLRRNLYPLLLLIGTFGFFTMLRNKDARYTMPLLVSVALIAAYWVFQLPKPYWRWAAGAITVYCLAAFWAVSFGLRVIPQQTSFNLKHQPIIVFRQGGYIIDQPTKENWHQEEIFRLITRSGDHPTLTFKGPESLWFNAWGLKYYSSLYGVDYLESGAGKYYLVRDTTMPEVANAKLLQTYQLPDQTKLWLFSRN